MSSVCACWQSRTRILNRKFGTTLRRLSEKRYAKSCERGSDMAVDNWLFNCRFLVRDMKFWVIFTPFSLGYWLSKAMTSILSEMRCFLTRWDFFERTLKLLLRLVIHREFRVELKEDPSSVFSSDIAIENSDGPIDFDISRVYTGQLEGKFNTIFISARP